MATLTSNYVVDAILRRINTTIGPSGANTVTADAVLVQTIPLRADRWLLLPANHKVYHLPAGGQQDF